MGPTLKIKNYLTILNDDNMTARALLEKYGKGKKFKYRKTLPFSSQRKFSAIEYEKYGVFALGAPDILFKDNYHLIEDDVIKYSEEGLRVLAFGHCDGDFLWSAQNLGRNTCVGIAFSLFTGIVPMLSTLPGTQHVLKNIL